MSEIRCEEANIGALRNQIAKAFGVTIIGRDMTLRMTGPSGEHLTFSFVMIGATDSSVKSCGFCGTRAGKLYTMKTQAKNCGGWTDLRDVEVCYDCWCPK